MNDPKPPTPNAQQTTPSGGRMAANSYRLTHARSFKAAQPWGAVDIAEMNGITIRLHWTDAPYQWHVNDGDEVFVILDGKVDMHVREGSHEAVLKLESGDVFHAVEGCEHVAHPIGQARILVIEKKGSV
jgi:mannose-6-phosphate isomerase-like protein (cupin superfamily)